MAKATRGKKKAPPKARAARKPRQPKSVSTSARSDEELRISLLSWVYVHGKPIDNVLSDTSKLFTYIKQGPAVETNSAPSQPAKISAPDEVHISVDPLPEAAPAPLAPKKHFDTEQISM